jgi:hypothetical protein
MGSELMHVCTDMCDGYIQHLSQGMLMIIRSLCPELMQARLLPRGQRELSTSFFAAKQLFAVNNPLTRDRLQYTTQAPSKPSTSCPTPERAPLTAIRFWKDTPDFDSAIPSGASSIRLKLSGRVTTTQRHVDRS